MGRRKIKSAEVELNEVVKKMIEDDVETFISTEHVLMNSEGIFIHGRNGFYRVCTFPFHIRYLIKDAKDNVFRIIEIPATSNTENQNDITKNLV